MSSVVNFPSCSCLGSSLPGKGSLLSREWKGKLLNAAKRQRRPTLGAASKMQAPIINARMVKPSTFSSKISTDIPFDEAPEASFAQYLEDIPRVFEAIFPDKQASQQLNEKEWRIYMQPIETPILTFCPVVDMRLKCNSNPSEYPSGVPHHIPKVFQFEAIRSELQGLDILKHCQFFLAVKGAMYCDRHGLQSRLKGESQLSVSIVLPPMLAFVSEHVCRDAVESILGRLTEDIKRTGCASVLSDYHEFKRKTLKGSA